MATGLHRRHGVRTAVFFAVAATLCATEAHAQTTEPIWHPGDIAVSGGVNMFPAYGSEALTEGYARAEWCPLSWTGISAEIGTLNVLALFPMGASAALGLSLRPWSRDELLVTPYLSGQLGLRHIPGRDGEIPLFNSPEVTDHFYRAEAGLDTRLGHGIFLSLGGGVLSSSSGDDVNGLFVLANLGIELRLPPSVSLDGHRSAGAEDGQR